MISFKNSFLLTEKVSNSEIRSALNDSNIRVGIEYEFILTDFNQFDPDYINRMENLYRSYVESVKQYIKKLQNIYFIDYFKIYLVPLADKMIANQTKYEINPEDLNLMMDKGMRSNPTNFTYLYNLLSNYNREVSSPIDYLLDHLPKNIPSLPRELEDFYYENGFEYGEQLEDVLEELIVDNEILSMPLLGALSEVLQKVMDTEDSPADFEYNSFGNDQDILENYPFWDDLPFNDYDINEYTSNYSRWTITTDASLPTGGVEIISPIMDIKTALDYMKKMFEFIKKHGETNSRCGLHVNMSYKGISLSNLDELKLMLFMDEGWVWKFFPERYDNEYTKSNFDEIRDMVSNSTKNTELEKITNNLVQKYKQKIKGPDEKFFGINTSHDDRIEFRYLGSSNYHKKYHDIQTAIGKYAFYLKIALDPKERQKEYVLKLERLFNKYAKNDEKTKKKTRDVPRIVLTQSHRIRLSDIDKYINTSPLSDDLKYRLRVARDRAKERGLLDVVFAFVPYKTDYEKKLTKAGFAFKKINDEKLKDYIKGFDGTGSNKDEYLLYYYQK
jgi:hypothetical protein